MVISGTLVHGCYLVFFPPLDQWNCFLHCGSKYYVGPIPQLQRSFMSKLLGWYYKPPYHLSSSCYCYPGSEKMLLTWMTWCIVTEIFGTSFGFSNTYLHVLEWFRVSVNLIPKLVLCVRLSDELRKEDLLQKRLWEKANLENYLAELRKDSKRRR